MEKQFTWADELMALDAFCVSGHGTEILLEDDCSLEAPKDVRGWLSLDQMHQDYGVKPDTLLAGLEAPAASLVANRGVPPVSPDSLAGVER